MENEDLGFVVSGTPLGEVAVSTVRKALEQAGFDDAFAKDIKPRNAFIRAARAMQKEGLLEEGNRGMLADRTVDQNDTLCYQFSAREQDGSRVVYDCRAVLQFDKKTEQLRVVHDASIDAATRQAVEKKLDELFSKYGYTYKSSDVTHLVNKMFASVTRKISLRAAVYYVPYTAGGLVEKVRKFYAALGSKLYVFSIGAHQADAQTDILAAVVDDITGNVAKLKKDIDDYRAEHEGAVSCKLARSRIREAAKDLRHYRDIAASLKSKLSDVLSKAGESGKVLSVLARGSAAIIEAVSSGGKADVLSVLLADAAEKKDGTFQAKAERAGLISEAVKLASVPQLNVGGSVTATDAPTPQAGVPQLAGK